MGYTYQLHSTNTGAFIRNLYPADGGSYGRMLTTGSSGSHTLPWAGNEGWWGDCPDDARTTFVVLRDGQAVYAGQVWGRTWDDDAEVGTVKHEDLWELLDCRLAINQGETRAPNAKLAPATRAKYTNLSQRTHIKKLLELGMIGPLEGHPGYTLPIDLPENEAGGFTEEWQGYDFLTVAEAVRQIAERDNGPLVDFRPYLTSGNSLRWSLEVFHDPTGDVLFPGAVGDAQLAGLKLTSSGKGRTTELHVTGAGSEDDVVYARRFDSAPPGVALARKISRPEIKYVLPVLDAANAEFAQAQHVSQQTEIDMVLDPADITDPIRLTDLTLGADITFQTYGSKVWQDGYHKRTLIGYTANNEDTVTLKLQSNPVSSSKVVV